MTSSLLSAIVLCAGKGTRLQELMKNTPKTLLKIDSLGNRTILEILLNHLLKLKFDEILIIKGHQGRKIDRFFSHYHKQNSHRFFDKVTAIDSGKKYKLGPLYSLLSLTKKSEILNPHSTYFIFPGDTIFPFSLLKSVIKPIHNHLNSIEKTPMIFYRRVELKFLKEKYALIPKNQIQSISIVQIKEKNGTSRLKSIRQVPLNSLPNKNSIYQIIPIFMLPFEFFHAIIQLEKKNEGNTLIDILNYACSLKIRIDVKEISNKAHFYDIDTKWDLLNFNKKLNTNNHVKEFY